MITVPRKFNRSQFTLELSYLQDDPDFDLFSFDYDFYEPQFKKEFENLFMDHYRYDEINSGSIERFQRQLMSRLNMIMPYYRQLYQTELRCQDIDFMVNKDYDETYTRSYTSDMDSTSTGSDNSTSSSDSTNSVDTDHKESILNNINAQIDMDNKLTGRSKDLTNDNTRLSSTSNGNNTNTSKDKHIISESSSTRGVGNIGVTSAADLVEGWRNVIININKMIIEECWDLFSLV